MGPALTKELGRGLVIIPQTNIQIPEVHVKSFSYNGTGGYCSVGASQGLILHVSLEQNNCMNSVNLIYSSVSNIHD